MPKYPEHETKENIAAFFAEYAKHAGSKKDRLIYCTNEILKTIEWQYRNTRYRTFSINSILRATHNRLNPTGLADTKQSRQITKSLVKLCLYVMVDYDLADFATKALDKNHLFATNPATKSSRYVFWLTIPANRIRKNNVKPSDRYKWITDILFDKPEKEEPKAARFKSNVLELKAKSAAQLPKKKPEEKQISLFSNHEKVVIITDMNGQKTWAKYRADTLDLIALMPSRIKKMEIIQMDKEAK